MAKPNHTVFASDDCDAILTFFDLPVSVIQWDRVSSVMYVDMFRNFGDVKNRMTHLYSASLYESTHESTLSFFL